MAITVDYLTGLGVEKEAAEKIFAERGKEIEREKAKFTALENELTEKKNAFEKLNNDFEGLKANNSTAEEFKAKYEALVKENKEKEEAAKAEKAAKEKADAINARFATVVGDKKFAHEAIKSDYARKFAEALGNKDFEGKSDMEIFSELVKNDTSAFAGARPSIAGVQPSTSGKKMTREEISKIKDTVTRQKAIADNIELYTTEGD